MDLKPLRVSEVNQYIKKIFSIDPILCNICVEGEISNFKHHYSGHMYFTLKDDKSRLKCVMFKSDNQLVDLELKDGMKVQLSGYISVFERDGDYQLYVKKVKESGLGDLYVAFEKMKNKLEKEGMFNILNKKKIPSFPRKIGVVTSSTGAAIRDIITVIKRRFPIVDIIIYPALVQGKDAPDEISQGLIYFDKREDIDLIITGRGGGSLEELYAFNDEKVARTIFSLNTPVISAVGHETDFTIADFVADLRAPTPSAAGELSVPELKKLNEDINSNFMRLINNFNSIKNEKLNELEYLKKRLDYNEPSNIIYENKQVLDNLFKQMCSHFNMQLKEFKNILENQGDKLGLLSPLSPIKRGYAFLSNGDGQVIKSTGDVKIQDKINIFLNDGILNVKVEKINKGEYCDGKGQINLWRRN